MAADKAPSPPAGGRLNYAPYTQAEIDALEATAKMQTGDLVPLLPPLPPSRTLPILPVRPSSPPPLGPHHSQWTCQPFVLPAAFPRSHGSTKPPSTPETFGASSSTATPASSSSKVALGPAIHELYTKAAEALQVDIDVTRPETFADQQQLYISVNCYRPKQSATPLGEGLTLVFAHANGFHKEIWEATMSEILSAHSTADTLPIDEIWALDLINQGDSAILNEAALGLTFNWVDYGRDVLQLVSSHIPSIGGTRSSPRKIVGIGHSIGGAATVYSASARPDLYSSIILVDPVLPFPGTERSTRVLTSGALMRRGEWPSLEEAKKSFLAKPFFRSWDDRVLEKHFDYGLRKVNGGEGRALKAAPRSEALQGVHSPPPPPPTLPVHFVFADTNTSVLNEEGLDTLIKEVPHCTSERVAGAGHLIAQSHPKELGIRIARVLKKQFPKKSQGKL